ncbi:MAG: NHL repeat-containing protein [Armatimonadota bacterium]
MISKFGRYLAAILLCTCILAGSVTAGSLQYNNQRKLVKAGVLTFASGQMPAFPYVFYVMDQRLDIKPAGWEFVNPLALSGDKERADYWQVPISIQFEDIVKYDVLFLSAPAGNNITFSREDKEKLRKFVDGGGVLWIESGFPTLYGTINFAGGSGFFIPDINFGNSGTKPISSMSPAHPIVARPFQLSWQEMNNIGFSAIPSIVVDGTGGLPDKKYFVSCIVDKDKKPYVSGAQYGSGHIVVSGVPVSQAIARTVGESSPGVCNSNNLIAAHSEDLKLAYNIVNWGSEYITFHKNPRRTGYSFAEIGAPLAPLWEYKTQAPGATFTSPVIIDDIVLYVDGGGTLHAFDLSPSRDRNLDGNPDDGIVDQSDGAPYDELWNLQVGTGASLTAGYVPLGGSAVPGVGVVTVDGKVFGFDASDLSPTPLPLFNVNQLSSFASASMVAPSLTYSDGGLYIGDGLGSLHGMNFFNSLVDWVAPKAPIASMGPAIGSPAAGYIYDRISGAMDEVVYLPRMGLNGATPTTGGIQVYPMKVYNDLLTPDAQGTGYIPLISRRSMGCSIRAGKWKLFVPTETGKIDITGNARLAAQPGTFEVDMDALSASNLRGKPILADYELDPAGAAFNPRSTIMIKANPNEPAGVPCTPALSPDDVLFFSTDNGSLYAVQESSDPDPRKGYAIRTEARWRWSLLDPEVKNLLNASSGVITPVGSPCVGNDMAYFAVNTDNGSYILAFKSDPLFEINLGVPIEPGTTLEFVQDDALNAGSEPTRVVFNPRDNTLRDWIDANYPSGKITIRNFRATGAPRQDLSASREISVGYIKSRFAGGDGQTRESKICYAFPQLSPAGLYYRPNPGDKWNNLSWCVRLPAGISSSPVLFGSKLYVGMNDGNLASMDVTKMKSAAEKLDINAVDASNNLEANMGVRVKWDRSSGFMWESSAMQGNNAPILSTVAGSNGMLAVATANGLSVLHNPITLVADSNRIAEIDSAGDIVWSCDATVAITETTTGTPDDFRYSASAIPFNRPAVARKTDIGGIVVADTGNNRIVLIDSGGRALWQITDFADPKRILQEGTSLSISKPMDVSAWMINDAVTGIPEYHFLIADSGNFRVVDIAVKWDDTLQSYKNELAWVSRSVLEGKQYQYVSARLVPDADDWSRLVVMSIISGQQAATSGPEGVGGALVKINYAPATESAGPVIGNPYVRLPIDVVNPAVSLDLLNPRYFTRVYKSRTDFTDLVIDANGINVVENGAAVNIRRYTPADYLADTNVKYGAGRPLFATYAQILPNGNILVTNKAFGSYGAGDIFELAWDPAKLPSAGYKIVWPESASAKFGSNSFGLRLPSSAERQSY